MSNVKKHDLLKNRLRSAIKTDESHPEGFGLDGLTEQSAKL